MKFDHRSFKGLIFTALFLGAISAGAELKESGQFVASECGLNKDPAQTRKDNLVISRICVGELYLTDKMVVELTFSGGSAIYYEIHFGEGQINGGTTVYRLSGPYIPKLSSRATSVEGIDLFLNTQIEGGRMVTSGTAGGTRSIITLKVPAQGLMAGAELTPVFSSL